MGSHGRDAHPDFSRAFDRRYISRAECDRRCRDCQVKLTRYHAKARRLVVRLRVLQARLVGYRRRRDAVLLAVAFASMGVAVMTVAVMVIRAR